jgi:hypothetical protein
MKAAEGNHPGEGWRGAISLGVYVAVLFSGLIILAGGVIGWFNYAQNAKVVLAASERVFAELHQDVVGDLELGSRRTRSMLSFDSVGACRARHDPFGGARHLWRERRCHRPFRS